MAFNVLFVYFGLGAFLKAFLNISTEYSIFMALGDWTHFGEDSFTLVQSGSLQAAEYDEADHAAQKRCAPPPRQRSKSLPHTLTNANAPPPPPGSSSSPQPRASSSTSSSSSPTCSS
jgi:hypothetical protein